MKWYKAIDAIGREWVVSREAVLEDYIKYLMQADNLTQEEALKKIYEYAHDNSSGPVSPDKLWEVRLIVEEVL